MTTTIALDFVGKFSEYASDWTKSYKSKTLSNDDLGVANTNTITITMSNVSKQPGTITDRPVVASKSGNTAYVEIKVADGSISEVEFDLKEWSEKKVFSSICIEYFDGTNWVNCSETITRADKLKSTTIGSNVTKVRLAVTVKGSSNVQLGLTAATIVVK